MNKTKRITQILLKFLKIFPNQFVLMSLLLCAEAIIAIVAVLAIVPLTDRIFDQSSDQESKLTSFLSTVLNNVGLDDSITIFATLFLIANLLKAIVDSMLRFCTLSIKYNVYKHYVLHTLSNIMRSNWSFFSNTNRGKLINSLQQELNNVANTMAQLASQVSHLVQLVIYCAIPVYLSPQVTFLALIFAVIVCAPFFVANKIGYNLGQKTTQTANTMVGAFLETISAMRLILSFSAEKVELDRNRNCIDSHVSASINSQTFIAAVGYLFQPLALIAVMLAAGTALSQGAEISSIAGVLWALLRAMIVLGKLVQTNVNIHNFIPSYEQIEKLNNEASRTRNFSKYGFEPTFRKSIKITKLSFSYAHKQQAVKKFSMAINQHAVTGLVGPSGSGKSTIIDLLLGLQSPDTGSIKVDGKELEELDLTKFRGLIGYVPQDPVLFNSSVADNIRWASKDAADSDIVRALTQSNAMEFVKKLPNGLDTIVGDRGEQLSGGQRQRITLARALVRNPSLLILDEATSSLDKTSQLEIKRALLSLKQEMAVLIITHQTHYTDIMDVIYHIKNGENLDIKVPK